MKRRSFFQSIAAALGGGAIAAKLPAAIPTDRTPLIDRVCRALRDAHDQKLGITTQAVQDISRAVAESPQGTALWAWDVIWTESDGYQTVRPGAVHVELLCRKFRALLVRKDGDPWYRVQSLTELAIAQPVSIRPPQPLVVNVTPSADGRRVARALCEALRKQGIRIA